MAVIKFSLTWQLSENILNTATLLPAVDFIRPRSFAGISNYLSMNYNELHLLQSETRFS